MTDPEVFNMLFSLQRNQHSFYKSSDVETLEGEKKQSKIAQLSFAFRTKINDISINIQVSSAVSLLICLTTGSLVSQTLSFKAVSWSLPKRL